MTNQTLQQALTFARYGWRVFPCQPGQKTPATLHGYLDATTDPAQIGEWFADHPERNLAVATGAPGPDVLDIDFHGPDESGYPALARLQSVGLLDGAVGCVRTPSGGRHIYFAGSAQRSGHLAACHVDFLAVGGYVLTPPSQVGGEPYQLLRGLGGRGGLDWQAASRLLQPPRDRDRHSAREYADPSPAQDPGSRDHEQHRVLQRAPEEQISALARWVAAQPEGNRNAGLFWAASRALEADQAADLSLLAAAAREAGLAEPEITRTLNSARRTSQARPEPPGRQAEGAS